MALSAARIAELKSEAREAVSALGTPESVLIYDFSVGAGPAQGGLGVQVQVDQELRKHSIDILKMAKIFKRPVEQVYRAIAGKAENQGMTISAYMEEFALQYREIGLPVFTN
jgi:hypothetical protein